MFSRNDSKVVAGIVNSYNGMSSNNLIASDVNSLLKDNAGDFVALFFILVMNRYSFAKYSLFYFDFFLSR